MIVFKKFSCKLCQHCATCSGGTKTALHIQLGQSYERIVAGTITTGKDILEYGIFKIKTEPWLGILKEKVAPRHLALAKILRHDGDGGVGGGNVQVC